MSHQLAVDVRDYGGGKKVAEELEKANIILNRNLLPYDDQNNREKPSGIRIGFQDVTRRGFTKDDIKYLCDLMLEIIKGKRKPEEVRENVIALRREHCEIKYGFQSLQEAMEYLQRSVKGI
jgi:glycine hydroxymethyltransferase